MIAAWARLVSTRPRLIVAATIAVVVVVGFGVTRTEPEPDLVEALVPDRTDLKDALARIDDRFGGSERTTTAQVIVRGDVIDPFALEALDATVDGIVADPVVAPFVADPSSVVTHPRLIGALAGSDVADLTPSDVATVLALNPSEPTRLLLEELLVRDESGTVVAAVGWIELRRGSAEGEDVLAAERRIGARLEAASLGPASARALTNAAFEDATDEAMNDSLVLFPVAIVLLVSILYIGYRSASDVLATFSGMVLVTIFTLGAEGWLGPAGIGLLGGATAIGVVIPVLLVGLTVDYALQVTSAYRGLMAARLEPRAAAAAAVGTAGGAVALGAATTAFSFLTNLASPLAPVRDFGVLTAIGIGAGLVVMTGFVPAMRVIVDPKRGRHNRALLRGELLIQVPGASNGLRALVGSVARYPVAVVVGAALIGIGAAGLALGVDVRFETEDFLPSDSDFIEDSHFLDDVVGGADSTVTAVIVGDMGTSALGRSIDSLDSALAAADRPAWIVGPARNLVDDRGGDDTILRIVPVRLGDTDERRAAMDWFDEQWTTDSGRLTLTGELILPFVVADAVARSQVIATAVTILAALGVLTLYFARVHGQGSLGAVVVAPIVLVLTLVLAIMRVLDIPYNALTATLTALTIGIGVDYTIHVVHRFLASREMGASLTVALASVAVATGGALVVSAVTTMIGFGILVVAPLPAVGQLGLLMALTVVLSLAVSLVVVPALLVLVERERPARRRAVVDVRDGRRSGDTVDARA